jgi:hypothetical protein
MRPVPCYLAGNVFCRGRRPRAPPGSRPPPHRRGRRPRGKARCRRARSGGAPRSGSRAHRGRPRCGEDDARPGAVQVPGLRSPPRPVHERSPSQRHPGRVGVRPAPRGFPAAAGAHLLQRAPGGRDQPRQPAHAVGPPRGDERGTGQHRRPDDPAAGSLLRHRHPEPGRLRGDLSPPGVAARPLHGAAQDRLPAAPDRDAPPSRRRHRSGAGRAGGARSGEPRLLAAAGRPRCVRSGAQHVFAGGAPRDPHLLRPLPRRVDARRDEPGPGRTRSGPSSRPAILHRGRHPRSCRLRPVAPRPAGRSRRGLHALARRGRGRRPRRGRARAGPALSGKGPP